MHRIIFLLCAARAFAAVLAFWISWVLGAQDAVAGGGAAYAEGEVVVRLKPGVRDERAIAAIVAANRGAAALPRSPVRALSGVFVLRFYDGRDARDAAREIARDPTVLSAHPNFIRRTSVITPDDPLFDKQWSLAKVRIPEAWEIEPGKEVTVAVIDTGIDLEHPDIAANVWTNAKEIPGNGTDDDGNGYIDDNRGWNFVTANYGCAEDETCNGPSNDPTDHQGHGTHVAGIIAGVPNNRIGVAGVNGQAKVMALKAGYKDSAGDGVLLDSDSSEAIIYAADNGARVINMSWGGYEVSDVLKEAIDYAHAAGAILVAAVGNENTDEPLYPAGYSQKVIGVTATDQDDNRSDWGGGWASNFGAWVFIAAPGSEVMSLKANETNMCSDADTPGYCAANGTSMASPIVAGLASLMLSRDPGMDESSVREFLKQGAVDLGGKGFDEYFGHGRIDAYTTISLRRPDDTPPTITHEPTYSVEIGIAIPIEAAVADDQDSAPVVRLFFQPVGSNVWSMLAMQGSGGIFGATIPSEQVVWGGISYYIAAKDAAHNSGFSPPDAPASTHPVIVTDSIPPVIEHQPVETASVRYELEIRATVRDNVKLGGVVIIYRPTGGQWLALSVVQSGDLVTGRVPRNALPPEGIDYFVQAWDTSDNNAFLPAGAPDSSYSIVVVDDLPPAAATNLYAVPGDATLHLVWDRPATNEDGSPLTDLAGYRTALYDATSGGSWIESDVGLDTWADIGTLTNDHVYFLKVAAYDRSGNIGQWSEDALGLPTGGPTAVPDGEVSPQPTAGADADDGNETPPKGCGCQSVDI